MAVGEAGDQGNGRLGTEVEIGGLIDIDLVVVLMQVFEVGIVLHDEGMLAVIMLLWCAGWSSKFRMLESEVFVEAYSLIARGLKRKNHSAEKSPQPPISVPGHR